MVNDGRLSGRLSGKLSMRRRSGSIQSSDDVGNSSVRSGKTAGTPDSSGGGGLKRISSKMSQTLKKPAAVLSTAGQKPFRFRFDILVEYVDQLTCSEPVVIGLFRSDKELVTSPQLPDVASRRVDFNAKFELHSTLFRKPSDEMFAEKLFKVALKTSSDFNTIGKMHLDLAQYAVVPSGEKRIGASLSNGAVAVLHITSTFEGAGRQKGNSAASSSVSDSSSLVPSVYNGSSVANDLEQDNLDDLLDEDDLSDSLDNDSSLVTAHKVNAERQGSGRARSEGDNNGSALKGLLESPKRKPSILSRRESGKVNADTEKARLQKRIAYLERRNDELAEQNRALIEASESTASGSGVPKSADDLAIENERLHAEARELESLIAREPEMHNLVTELKEVKVALAMVNFEREQFHLEIMKLEKEAHHSKKRSYKKLFKSLVIT